MKQFALVLLALTLIAALVFVALTNQRILTALSRNPPPSSASTAGNATALVQPTRQLPVVAGDQVVAECKLAPLQSVQLSFGSGGVVDALLVKEGQVVLAGQVLARLGGRKTIEAEIASAQRELAAAESAMKAINDDAFLATAQALKDVRDLETAEKDAKKNLRDLQDDKESDDKIAQAEANLALVRARLEKAGRAYEMLKNGPDAEKLAAAELRLKDAQAKLAAAQERLSALEILAPFNATVIKIDMAPGEFASPGAPAILLADLAKYHVETTDLSELNVLNVQPGEKAEVTFDALPEQKFPGMVRAVQPLAEDILGETVFHAIIDGDFSGKGLMWGMTCSVVIGE